MWFEILPAFIIITGSIGLPGLGLWWAHYFVNGNSFTSSTGNKHLDVSLRELFEDCLQKLTKSMWYEILPSFFIITAALGLPGWGLYHIHNLANGNHYRRSLLDRWDRSQYQRDMRLTGNPYKVNGLESIPDK